MGRNSTTLNTFFVGQIGDDPTIDGLEFQYNWQFKHELSHRVAFDVEAFGEIEDLAHPGSFTDQLHRAGPVLYLNFGEEEEGSAAEKRESEEGEHEQKSEAPELKMAAGVCSGCPAPPPTSRSSWLTSSNSKVLRSEKWLTTQK